MVMVVVSKFCSWEELCPVVLMVADKVPQVVLNSFLGNLRLAISLRVECG